MSGTAAPQTRLRAWASINGAGEEVSLFGFVNVLLRHRLLIIGWAIALGVITATGVFRQPRMYASRATYAPRSADVAEQQGNLLAQLGMHVAEGIAAVHAELLLSRPVLTRVINAQYEIKTRDGVVRGNLLQLRNQSGPQAAEDRIAELRRRVRIQASRGGLSSIIVRDENPHLAQQIAARLLTELQGYYEGTRRAQSTAEREFVESRLAEARRDLAEIENTALRFYSENRDVSAPHLTLQAMRLQREAALRMQLYGALVAGYESARITEVRELPTIYVIEEAQFPFEPEPAAGLRNSLLGAVGGLFLGIVLAFVRERVEDTRLAGAPVFIEYEQLKQQTVRDLRRPWQRFLRERPAPVDPV